MNEIVFEIILSLYFTHICRSVRSLLCDASFAQINLVAGSVNKFLSQVRRKRVLAQINELLEHDCALKSKFRLLNHRQHAL